MMKQAPQNHLKKKCIANIQKSRIFFTAPHSKRLNRGGKEYSEKLRIHKREIYTSFLTCDLARGTGKNSYLFWGVSSVISDADIDPNYLLKQHFRNHLFHQALHNWAYMNSQLPLLHIDIHGKMDRQNNCEIDVGIRCMEAYWEGDPLIGKIKKFFDLKGNIFEGLKFKGHPCRFNTDPDLHGYWGGDIHTMTEQSIILGIPSIQFEIPLAVRKKLFRDSQLRKKFHKMIQELYSEVIISDYSQKKRKYNVQEQIAKMFVSTIKTEKESEEVHQQIARYETKEESTPNQNKNI